MLTVTAAALLGSTVWQLLHVVAGRQIQSAVFSVMDSILVVMMLAEIVYTVTISLRLHKLMPEPFLVVGLIAVIRRMLVITAEPPKVSAETLVSFQGTMLELGLEAVIILVLVVAIYLLRRRPVAGESPEEY